MKLEWAEFADSAAPKRLLSCPTRLVLRAALAPKPQQAQGAAGAAAANALRRLEINALVQKGAKSHHLHLMRLHVLVESTHAADAEEWVQLVMKAAYPGEYWVAFAADDSVEASSSRAIACQPCRREGQVPEYREEHSHAPARSGRVYCRLEGDHTPQPCRGDCSGHGAGLRVGGVQAAVADGSVIATASGDGLVYEVLNGLAQRPDGRSALRTPIAPLPTGSACACCTNLFGTTDTFNIELATLNIIKGGSTTCAS